jgi:hypothetical protein
MTLRRIKDSDDESVRKWAPTTDMYVNRAQIKAKVSILSTCDSFRNTSNLNPFYLS